MNPDEVFSLEMSPPLHHRLHHQDNPLAQLDFPANYKKEKGNFHIEQVPKKVLILNKTSSQPVQGTPTFGIPSPICLENGFERQTAKYTGASSFLWVWTENCLKITFSPAGQT